MSRPATSPTFAIMLDMARRDLGSARDWLASDWSPGTGPTGGQAAAFRRAQRLIGEAKAAIDECKRVR